MPGSAKPVQSVATAPAPAAVSDVKKAKFSKAAPPKPDNQAYNKQLAEVNERIDKLKARLATVQETISGTDNIKTSYSGKQSELRAKLNEIKQQQTELRDARKKLVEQLRDARTISKKKNDELRSAKDKLPFRSVEDYEKRIKELEAQIESGQCKLVEEKKILSEISKLKQARKSCEALNAQSTGTESEKSKADGAKKKLEELDPQLDALKAAYEDTINQLNALNSDKEGDFSKLKTLYDERNGIRKELDAEYDKLREIRANYKQIKEDFFAHVQEEKARRQELFKKRREEEEEERHQAAIEQARELAEIPAYEEEINLCNTLIAYLRNLGNPDAQNAAIASTKPKPGLSRPSNVPAPRQVSSDVPEGVKMLSKKSDREEEYLVIGKGKKGNKKGANNNSNTPSSDSSASKPAPFRMPLQLMERFWELKVEVPSSMPDVDKTVTALEEKRKFFLDNQEKKNAENKAKAAKLEAELIAKKQARAEGKEDSPAAEEVNGDVDGEAVEGKNVNGEVEQVEE